MTDPLADRLDAHLAQADADLTRRYPGDRGVRQPVHTVYVPADRFDAGTVPAWGERALAALAEHGDTADTFAAATGLDPQWVHAGYDRVLAKLAVEPIEDLRIDFEDGYGPRPDAEEDAAVVAAAAALRQAVDAGTAPPFVGIRFKSFEQPTRRRGLRTLRLFLAGLGALPAGFVLTLPKVTSVEQVEAMVLACEALETELGLAAGALRFEIQVETPQAVLGADGRAAIAPMIHAGAGRVTGLHYGTYDYSASLGISAQDQSMEHPAADHAKAVMQLAASGTGVHLSDGSTNIVPVGDADAVRAAWALHARLVGRSLHRGYYQGWDLHPAQLPTRYAATYAFYLAGIPQACVRLRAYVERQESGFMDEPATAVALAGFLVRALECGAVDADEITERTGLHRSTLDVLARRVAV
ncbi:aldolase [Nakamurella flavida]|uniref:Aldolase n=1 Tax=Nakamurella flavida TaxID=363630 RepID=A0A939C769_9ACTN|nr:aldolase/citrate lyase family protein [Nakamurella flavida]MBM9477857.1 aldolase [Nakamurella flavida]MDP9779412.1 citrate lyase beta subunit [Nakamurella flavida]